jgi:hypothetical protein
MNFCIALVIIVNNNKGDNKMLKKLGLIFSAAVVGGATYFLGKEVGQFVGEQESTQLITLIVAIPLALIAAAGLTEAPAANARLWKEDNFGAKALSLLGGVGGALVAYQFI